MQEGAVRHICREQEPGGPEEEYQVDEERSEVCRPYATAGARDSERDQHEGNDQDAEDGDGLRQSHDPAEGKRSDPLAEQVVERNRAGDAISVLVTTGQQGGARRGRKAAEDGELAQVPGGGHQDKESKTGGGIS